MENLQHNFGKAIFLVILFFFFTKMYYNSTLLYISLTYWSTKSFLHCYPLLVCNCNTTCFPSVIIFSFIWVTQYFFGFLLRHKSANGITYTSLLSFMESDSPEVFETGQSMYHLDFYLDDKVIFYACTQSRFVLPKLQKLSL